MLTENIPNPIKGATYDFLISNYGNRAKYWIDNINDTIKYLSVFWNINITDGSNFKSRFGCLLLGTVQGIEVVLKLIPPCCPRLEQEIKCYSILPYHNMAELIASDLEKGALLLKRIYCKPIDSIDMIADLFEAMYKERTVATNEQLTLYQNAFFESLGNAFLQVIQSNDKHLARFLTIISHAKTYYNNQKETTCYLLHGDVHINNILFDGEQMVLIDPIGYIGPFEIEYARFIGTFIRENDLNGISLETIIEKISRQKCSTEKIAIAVGYDVTMRACNTFIEGNTYDEILAALEWAEKTWGLVEQTVKR